MITYDEDFPTTIYGDRDKIIKAAEDKKYPGDEFEVVDRTPYWDMCEKSYIYIVLKKTVGEAFAFYIVYLEIQAYDDRHIETEVSVLRKCEQIEKTVVVKEWRYVYE